MEAINKNQAKNNTRSLSIEAINISKAKQLVTPFAELDDYDQRDITKLKNAFAQYDSILLEHLTRFDLGELSDRLAWIPFELFKDVRKLAKGGFGTVFVAGLDFPSVYVSEDGMVALKVLDENLLHEVVFSTQLSYIKHTVPVTASVFGLTQDDKTGEFMMVMEYAAHGNMEQLQHGSSWNRIADMGIEISRRLQAMHSIGIIHQDLHPGNVVFVKKFPRLIDVGLSKAVEGWSEDDGIYGRLKYHPPEVFYGKPYTMKSDIYCLGTLLWQAVTGVPPRATAKEMCEIREDGMREDLISDAPSGFNDAIRRCWDPEPSKRPTAGEFCELIRSCRNKNNLFPRSQTTIFSPETEAFIAKCQADYTEEMSDPNSFALFSAANSSRFMSRTDLQHYFVQSPFTSRHRMSKIVQNVDGDGVAKRPVKSDSGYWSIGEDLDTSRR